MSVVLSRLSTTGRPMVRFGHEVVVHHVDVQPVGAGHGGGSARREVGGQDAGRDVSGAQSTDGAIDVPARHPAGPWPAARKRSAGRSAAPKNIASVPCRCGHSCNGGPPPRGPARPNSGRASSTSTRAAQRRRRPTRVSARCGEHVTYATSPGGAAANADASSSRCSLVSGGRSSGWRRQRASGRRRSAPSRCTARRPAPGRTPRGPARPSRPSARPRRPAGRGRTPRRAGARCWVTSTAVTRAPARAGGQRGQQRGLATRPGAQVQPPLVLAVNRRLRRAGRDQLAALVLDVRPPAARTAGRSPGRRRTGRRRTGEYGPDAAVRRRGQFVGGRCGPAGRTRCTSGRRCRPPAALAARPGRREHVRERPHDPRGWAWMNARCRSSPSVGRRDLGQPVLAPPILRSTALAKPIAPGATDRTRSTVVLVAACARHPHVQQLVGAQRSASRCGGSIR